ncbi:MAG: hypothetical protein L0K38_13175, partial [Yaniella sp.]|uniref:hypothetical protein n=1 Tax=Yaniella sp. TaxID=2773929 RepID=UPI0026473770
MRSPDDGGSHTDHFLESLNVHHATVATPDLTVFCRLDKIDLVAVDQRLDSAWAATCPMTVAGAANARHSSAAG